MNHISLCEGFLFFKCQKLCVLIVQNNLILGSFYNLEKVDFYCVFDNRSFDFDKFFMKRSTSKPLI